MREEIRNLQKEFSSFKMTCRLYPKIKISSKYYPLTLWPQHNLYVWKSFSDPLPKCKTEFRLHHYFFIVIVQRKFHSQSQCVLDPAILKIMTFQSQCVV